MNIIFCLPIMAVLLQHSKCVAQGTSFWKPRGFDLRTEDKPKATKYRVHYPSTYNIQNYKVVLINGYSLGTSMIAIATVGFLGRPKFPQFDMRSADFYTNAYRWALRALSLIPEWAAGKGTHYADSHKVWRKRFYYNEHQVPDWMRKILFFVDDWDREAWARKRYVLYAKPAFDKHLRYPSKVPPDTFDFDSFNQTKETVENLDDSEAETVRPRSMEWGPTIDNDYDWLDRIWWPLG